MMQINGCEENGPNQDKTNQTERRTFPLLSTLGFRGLGPILNERTNNLLGRVGFGQSLFFGWSDGSKH